MSTIVAVKLRFVLIYGKGLDPKFVEALTDELNVIPDCTRHMPVVDADQLIQQATEAKHPFIDEVVVLVAHSALVVDEDSGAVSYIDEMSSVMIEYLRDNSAGFWFAGCDAGNIDVTFTNTKYSLDGSHFTNRVHPFGVVDFSPLSVPVVPASWLYAFLKVTRDNDIKWWACKMSFYYDILTASERAWLLTAVWCRMGELIDDGLPFTDCLLYPYHVSFPEVVHFAVFRAVYPHKSLLLLMDSVSQEPKIADAQRHMLFLTEEGRDGNENWLCKMDTEDTALLRASINDNKRNKLIRYFQCCHGPGLSGELRDMLKKHKPTVGHDSTLIAEEVRRRLFLTENIIVDSSTIPHVAIVCRTFQHEQGDMRMSISSEVFLKTVKLVCEKAEILKWGVVLMDGDSTDVLQFAKCICQAARHLPHRTDDHGNPLSILQQVQKVRRLVKIHNISAAVGIHGGFLDVLTLVGVPPQRTIHLCSDNDDSFVKKNLEGWQRRTKNFEDLFHSGEEAQWFETNGPTSAEVDLLFVPRI